MRVSAILVLQRVTLGHLDPGVHAAVTQVRRHLVDKQDLVLPFAGRVPLLQCLCHFDELSTHLISLVYFFHLSIISCSMCARITLTVNQMILWDVAYMEPPELNVEHIAPPVGIEQAPRLSLATRQHS